MKNKYICIYESMNGIEFIYFQDFIQGWDWVDQHKTEFKIIEYAELLNKPA